jgi:hypothetical protein
MIETRRNRRCSARCSINDFFDLVTCSNGITSARARSPGSAYAFTVSCYQYSAVLSSPLSFTRLSALELHQEVHLQHLVMTVTGDWPLLRGWVLGGA